MREQFEAWMTSEQGFHGSDFKWDEHRNCYSEFGIHIAYKAYLAAIASMQSERDQLAAQLADVAAENVALKGFSDKLNEMHNDLNGEGTGIQGRAEVACQQIALEAAMEEFDDIKTPSTDRFLAEQRAMGVEKCASVIQQQVWDESEGDGIVAALDAMEIYADQLRNEVKKI